MSYFRELIAMMGKLAARTKSKPGKTDFSRSELLLIRTKPVTRHAIAPRTMPNRKTLSVRGETA